MVLGVSLKSLLRRGYKNTRSKWIEIRKHFDLYSHTENLHILQLLEETARSSAKVKIPGTNRGRRLRSSNRIREKPRLHPQGLFVGSVHSELILPEKGSETLILPTHKIHQNQACCQLDLSDGTLCQLRSNCPIKVCY